MRSKDKLYRLIQETSEIIDDIDGVKDTKNFDDVEEYDVNDLKNSEEDIDEVETDDEVEEDETSAFNVETVKSQILQWQEETGKDIDEIKSIIMDALADFEEEEGEEDTAEELRELSDEEESEVELEDEDLESEEDEDTEEDVDEKLEEARKRLARRKIILEVIKRKSRRLRN